MLTKALEVSYAKWAETAASLGPPLAHVWIGGGGTEGDHTSVEVVAGNRDFLVLSHLSGDDEDDWDTDFKADSTACSSEDDAFATCISELRQVTPSPAKLWNAPLKNGSSPNMAVNGSVTPVVFQQAADSSKDIDLQVLCLISEFTGSVAIGNKFIADAIGTLANGLLLEAKLNDSSYTWANMKRTRDLIEVSQPQGGFNVITGATSLFQVFFYIPPCAKMCKQGSFATDDYVKATVRDNLSSFSFLEMFLQGVKI